MDKYLQLLKKGRELPSVIDYGVAFPKRLGFRVISYPARFDPRVVRLMIELFTQEGDVVLDPMCGSGIALWVAISLSRRAIGYDISPKAIEMSRELLRQTTFTPGELLDLRQGDARHIPLHNESVDFVITSPPYHNIIKYSKYGLENYDDYSVFLSEWQKCIEEMYRVLKPSKYCVIEVQDPAKEPFRPLHVDTINLARKVGFIPHDIYIWRFWKSRPLMHPVAKKRSIPCHGYLLVFKARALGRT